MRSLLCAAFAACLVASACDRAPKSADLESPQASEARLLTRQVASLREALADAKQGRLFPPDRLAIGISERAIQSIVQQALPIEQKIGTQFVARVERATFTFRAMQGAVRLEGRIWAVADSTTYANLVLMGGVRTVTIDEKTGTLNAEIALDGFDVTRAAAVGNEAQLITQAARLLGTQGLDALRSLVPPINIPVGVQQDVELPGVANGPVSIPPGRLMLNAAVFRLLPLSGKLWVMVNVTTPGWRPLPPVAKPPIGVPSRKGSR